MAVRALPPQEVLRQLLDYDAATGVITWRCREERLFPAKTPESSAHLCRVWNARYGGKPAFTAKKSTGYHHGSICGVTITAHRLIWAWMTGEEPDTIDHINGDVTDNAWGNLRNVSRSQNLKNAKLPKHNTSGIVGVRWDNRRNKWVAQIKSNGVVLYLGRFGQIDGAITARRRAEREFGFHENHGRSQ